MKRLFAKRTASRMAAILAVIESFVFFYAPGTADCMWWILLSLMFSAGAASLLMYPGAYENAGESLAMQLVLLFTLPVSRLAGFRPETAMFLLPFFPLSFILYRTFRKYRTPEAVLSDYAAQSELEDSSRLVWTLIYFAAQSIVAMDGSGIFRIPGAFVFIILFCIQFVRAYSGYSMLVPFRTEDRLHSAMAENRRMLAATDDNEARMDDLYRRVAAYMDSEKPFLSSNFKLDDLARAMTTNRTYLSYAINRKSGKGFPQFVNSYRVRRAIEIIEDNPHITVRNIALKVGYNNPVTFTLAFESITGETPGGYCQRIISSSALGGLSRKMGQEQAPPVRSF